MHLVDLTKDELLYIDMLENKMLDLNEIINNDVFFGELLFYFFNLNNDFFNDDKLRKLRNNNSERKVKTLKRLDPFYEVDSEVLKID